MTKEFDYFLEKSELCQLRIGNAIIRNLDDNSPIPIRVNSVSIISHLLINGNDSIFYQPIRLNTLHLARLGFTRFGNQHYSIETPNKYLPDFELLLTEGGAILYTEYSYTYTSGRFLYVHELQNLHFAISGKELTYDSELEIPDDLIHKKWNEGGDSWLDKIRRYINRTKK